MKTQLLVIFAILSLLVGACFLRQAVFLYKNVKRAKRLLSPIQMYTLGVFASVVLVFVPIYYTSYDFGDSYSFVRPTLIAIHNSLRIFILDGDFDIIRDSLADQRTPLRVAYSLYCAFLYVIAPVLTFGNVLSLFKNIRGQLRYSFCRRRKHYIMSELNEKSIALAKSIHAKEPEAVLVFTDVFEQNEEDDYELMTEARDINAICLKMDITHLDILSRKGDVEIFLMGGDESENISQAVKITKELNRQNTKQNVKVFLFSTSPGASYIADSVPYENLLAYAGRNQYTGACFKLRRIDEKQQLIWNTVPKMRLFDLAQRNDNTLSVLILGAGSYGMAFFKTLVWYCQMEGYRLRINLVDQNDHIRSVIDRDCPDLLANNRSERVGDAQYDIRLFTGIDVQTTDLDELLLYEGYDAHRQAEARRLRDTNLVFVSLGDDDRNIETGIHLRTLFDRIKGVEADKNITWEEEPVEIYSVVYDDQKSGILHSGPALDGELRLVNHKDIPYHIHFIGGMSSQFAYSNIYDPELERCAYAHHRSWVDAEEMIYQEWQRSNETQKIRKHDWYYMGQKTAEAAAQARERYEKYEYYRFSSIAKEMYRRQISDNPMLKARTTCLEREKRQTCTCENCVRRKRSEHMRWVAYSRAMGYLYHKDIRADRAKLHKNMCPWEELSELDRLKD